jgi:4-hydroxyphenylpyruvate dioxygenase
MRDPASGAKFANNEPWRPDDRASQVNVLHEEMGGDGVQRAALT